MNGTVLLVDDCMTFQSLMSDILTEAGFHVVIAENGSQALEILNSSEVSIVISDLLMPVMNGHEMAKVMKASPKWQNIPVIGFTGHPIAEPQQMEIFDAVLSKPIVTKDLFEAMKVLLTPHPTARFVGTIC